MHQFTVLLTVIPNPTEMGINISSMAYSFWYGLVEQLQVDMQMELNHIYTILSIEARVLSFNDTNKPRTLLVTISFSIEMIDTLNIIDDYISQDVLDHVVNHTHQYILFLFSDTDNYKEGTITLHVTVLETNTTYIIHNQDDNLIDSQRIRLGMDEYDISAENITLVASGQILLSHQVVFQGEHILVCVKDVITSKGGDIGMRYTTTMGIVIIVCMGLSLFGLSARLILQFYLPIF